MISPVEDMYEYVRPVSSEVLLLFGSESRTKIND